MDVTGWFEVKRLNQAEYEEVKDEQVGAAGVCRVIILRKKGDRHRELKLSKFT